MTSLEHLGYRQELKRALTFRDLVGTFFTAMSYASMSRAFPIVTKESSGSA
jgi:hypothetical protein